MLKLLLALEAIHPGLPGAVGVPEPADEELLKVFFLLDLLQGAVDVGQIGHWALGLVIDQQLRQTL